MSEHRANTGPRPDKSQAAGFVLQERDEALLAWLFPHGVAERGQVEETFFTSTARCNARLLQLLQFGLIARCPRAQQRSDQAIYKITAASYPVIARRLGLDIATVRRIHRARTNQHVEHALAIVDCYLAVRKALKNGQDLQLDLWLVEWQIRHSYQVREAGRLRQRVFRPDAFLRLTLPSGTYASFFAEIDRAHVSRPRWQQTVAHHLAYAQSGLFGQVYGTDTPFSSLVVTSGGERRLAHLKGVAEALRADRFYFTTEERLQREGFLAPIWQTIQGERPVSLLGDSWGAEG